MCIGFLSTRLDTSEATFRKSHTASPTKAQPIPCTRLTHALQLMAFTSDPEKGKKEEYRNKIAF